MALRVQVQNGNFVVGIGERTYHNKKLYSVIKYCHGDEFQNQYRLTYPLSYTCNFVCVFGIRVKAFQGPIPAASPKTEISLNS